MSSKNFSPDPSDMEVDDPYTVPEPQGDNIISVPVIDMEVITNLCQAVITGDSELANNILSTHSIELDSIRDEQGNTLLHWVVLRGDIELVAILIGHGAGVNSINNQRETPLFVAKNSDAEIGRNIIDFLESQDAVENPFAEDSLANIPSGPPASPT